MRANVFCGDGRFRLCELTYQNDITELSPLADEADPDGADYVVPGLVDVHTHGAMGHDVCDGDADGLLAMSRYYAKRGVTSFLATTMTYPERRLTSVLETLRGFVPDENGARCLGVNLEGPFLNPAKKGAQNGDYIVNPDVGLFRRLYEASGGRIRLVDIAPEREGGLAFIREAAKLCRVSLAHTEADYDTALAALDAGADHVTHLFNAMPPFAHRAPGVMGAAFDRRAYVELICDGIHVHPAAVRAAFRLFGPDRVCLISDSMECAGLGDGAYTLGGQAVTVQNGRAALADGTIAGSSIHLMDALQNAVAWGIDLETAVRAVTQNPADSIGCGQSVGRLAPGSRADFVLLDRSLAVKDVFIGGKAI